MNAILPLEGKPYPALRAEWRDDPPQPRIRACSRNFMNDADELSHK